MVLMPSSVHKILMHSESIIAASFPIGQLSEDAQESRIMDYTHRARKCSRLATNENVFHTLFKHQIRTFPALEKHSKSVKALDEGTLF